MDDFFGVAVHFAETHLLLCYNCRLLYLMVGVLIDLKFIYF